MTDSEILKALEYCATFNDGDCDECQYGDGGCRAELIVDAFALVNHLKAKNKELDEKLIIHRGTIDWQAKEINRQKAEIEALKKFIEKDQGLIVKLTNVPKNEYDNKIKCEAIKEFAERLKDMTIPVQLGAQYKYDVITRQGIDHLVKEMGGDEK